MANKASFYLSLPRSPVYLKEWNRRESDDLALEHKPKLTLFSTLFVIDPVQLQSQISAEMPDVSYVRSCLSTVNLFRQLVEEEDLSDFEFVLGTKRLSDHTTRRQLFALVADASNLADDKLFSLAQKNNCTVWAYEKDTKTSEPSGLWKLKDCKNNGMIKTMPQALVELEDNCCPSISPIFQESGFSPVFHDYKRTMEVLHMYKECSEVQQLLDIAGQNLLDCRSLSQLQDMMTQPLVVVEGMDATGKTTLTEFLEEKLDAARYSTPPPCLLPLRRFFDKLPEIVRRAYYSLGNYIVAQQIAAECQTRAVVMDRYWHSTAAYGIANETSFDDLPPADHDSYCWPADLLKPTAVVFLTVSEQVRRQRLGNRHDDTITFEERSLNKDQLFRKRLCEAYLRMWSPACVEVDASGSKEGVVAAVLKQLHLQGVCLQ